MAELMQAQSIRRDLSPEDLFQWIVDSYEGLENEGDEYQFQVESDDQAVNIVTMHASKGLEYKIVFCPSLSLTSSNNQKGDFLTFKNLQNESCFTIKALITEDQKASNELMQNREYRRLVYVAITRAIYQCVVVVTNNRLKHTLKDFLSVIDQSIIPITEGANEGVDLDIANRHIYSNPLNRLDYNPGSIVVPDREWRILSYSGLSAKGEHSAPDWQYAEGDDYDTFIYHDLKRGNQTGEMIHKLFEVTDFGNYLYWKKNVLNVGKQFGQDLEAKSDLYIQLIQNVVKASINIENQSFCLTDVNYGKILRELEFNFLVGPVQIREVQRILESLDLKFYFRDQELLNGFLNGFIDLFFEYEGQYYILDWKSNFLGDHLGAYNSVNVLRSMDENNYHLQYLIYTVAAVKYLLNRLKNFDYNLHFGGVIYMFVRGVRENAMQGIFLTKLPSDLVQRVSNILSPQV